MCNNGKTFVEYLTPAPGGTAENATYQLGLDHYTCGNKKLCITEAFMLSANVQFKPIGAPVSLGNNSFCQEVQVSGTVTYMPYKCGCQCGVCPVTENIYCTICLPCSSAVTPTLTAGTAVASPTNVQPCCNVTNAIAITTTVNVATA